MKLYFKTVAISIKYSFRAAALPFVALLFCLAFVLLALPQSAQPQKLSVGIRCLDTHPLIPMLTQAVMSSAQVEEFAELHMLSPNEPADGFAAVITLPQGFTDSILSGENLSPTVQLTGGAGISTIYIRELCTAVERYLASAQAGIYATMGAVEGLPPEQYSRILTDINISYVTLFLNRQSMLDKEFHSYDSFYMMRCVVSVLLFLLCGALGGAMPSMLATARSMGGMPGSSPLIFAGVGCGVFVFCLPVTLLCLVAAFGTLAWQQPLAVVLLAALMGAVSMFFFVAADGSGTAAIVLCGFTLVTALFSGLIIPMEILPQAMTSLAPLLPIYHVRELVTVISGGYMSGGLGGVVAQILLWLSASGLLWVRGVRRV